MRELNISLRLCELKKKILQSLYQTHCDKLGTLGRPLSGGCLGSGCNVRLVLEDGRGCGGPGGPGVKADLAGMAQEADPGRDGGALLASVLGTPRGGRWDVRGLWGPLASPRGLSLLHRLRT